MSAVKKLVEDWRKDAVALWEHAHSAARERDAMKGKSHPESVETLKPVVCAQEGLCVGCSGRTQYGLHIDVGTIDATFFACTDCLASALGGMILLREKCETEAANDA